MTNLKAAGSVAMYTLGEMIPRILSFLLLPVLTKYLSTSDYGISSYINTVLTFLLVLTTLSVNTYTLRSYYKIKSEPERKKLLANMFLFLIGWGAIMLCIEMLLFPVLLNMFSVKVPFYPFFFLALIINFFDVISVIPLVIYRVNEDAKGFVMLSVGRTILQYLLILLLVAYFKMGLLGSFLGRLVACLPFAVIYFLIIKKKGIFSINISQIKKALIFSLPLLPGALSFLVITILDRVILERFVSLSDLGIYSVAATLALTLNIVIQGLYRSFEQKIFRTHNSEGYREFVDKLFKIYIVSLYVPAFCITLFAREILLFFTTSQYYAAETYVVYLATAVIISGINIFLGTLLIADNRRKIVSYVSVISAVFSVIINLVLIKYFGVLGACIASILSFLMVCIFYYNKVMLVQKYLIPQLSFIAVFFASAYLIPDDISTIFMIIIKLLLIVAFLFFAKRVVNIEVPSFVNLKMLKPFRNNL